MCGANFEKGCSFYESNLMYTDMTSVGPREAGVEISFKRVRFERMFDMSRSKASYIDLKESFVAETLKMDGAEFDYISFDGMNVRGMVIESFHDEWNEDFKKRLEERNGSDGLSILRMIMESESEHDLADTLFVMQKRKEHDDLESLFKRCCSNLSYYLGGYGMRPLWTLFCMAFVIMLYSCLFLCSTGLTGGALLPEMGGLDVLYVSLSSFFTIDLPQMQQHELSVDVLRLSEGMIGLAMMLYFTVLVTRKILR